MTIGWKNVKSPPIAKNHRRRPASGVTVKTMRIGSFTLDRRSIDAQWCNGGPVITAAITVACVIVWLLEILSRYMSPTLFTAMLGSGMFMPITAVEHPWTWLTSMFLHSTSILHVGFNMMALWSVGPVLERLFGHWRFLALYLISGFGGAVGVAVWCRITGNWLMAAYGASGAIFGLFAALLIVFRRMGADIRSMLVCMVINFAMPVVIPNIAWQAHVGGFLVGGLLTWLLMDGVPALRRQPFPKRMWIYGSMVTVVLVAVLVLCVPPIGRIA